ncbi:RNA polymerase, sigma 29 subunit, SigE [Quadrisphaera granulorum]|uniref:RNA polymerase sigma-29 (SigE) subunit n=2 Tax=Quadrisphaera granulorum TaxID=317664 RepID=A0A316AFQ6_9ACTN|nr:RNA polymerase sigma-29 (SigE) subunit [Quadrisphaera granulorum]SZE94823.1 RNA polymerase, sigma 29 subunit, SigE [Quadrisphaera granulorum]
MGSMPSPDGAPRPSAATPSPEEQPWTPPSWDELVREHSARVHRLAYRLTGNRDDADDLTQEVFVRVFRSLDSYVPGTFEGWLHRITTNLFLDQTRRRRRLRFDALTEEIAARLPDRGAGPERAFEAGRFDVDVRAALERLSPDFRAVVVLADVEGLTYDEVADVLGVKSGTVRSRLHRARAQLRRHLEHRAPAPRRTGPRAIGGPGRVVPLVG